MNILPTLSVKEVVLQVISKRKECAALHKQVGVKAEKGQLVQLKERTASLVAVFTPSGQATRL